MGGPILCDLKLVLRVSPKPIPDTSYKDPRIVAIFTKEGLEFFQGYNNIRPFFFNILAFLLCPASANAISKNRGCKQSAILSVSSSCIKIDIALLAKPIVIQMRFSKIQFGKPSLNRWFFWLS